MINIPRKTLTPTQSVFNTYMHNSHGHEDRTKWSKYQFYPTPKRSSERNPVTKNETVTQTDHSQYREILRQLQSLQHI